jgi:hypothetical protein
LQPQILVSPQQQITKNDPFSAPFRVENVGYLPFRLTSLTCYLDHATFPHDIIMRNNVTAYQRKEVRLESQESETVQCPPPVGLPFPPNYAEIVIVVEYRPLLLPFTFRRYFLTFRRYFRFLGENGDTWEWLSQPSGQLQDRADRYVELLRKLQCTVRIEYQLGARTSPSLLWVVAQARSCAGLSLSSSALRR